MQGPRSLTEGSISRNLLVFMLPILLGNVLHSLNGSINSIWIGRFLGEAALTASANANVVIFLLIGGVFGISMATTILVGQHIGARDMPGAKRVVGASASFFFLSSLAMALLGWFAAEPLLVGMSTPADAMPYAMAYMRMFFLALPFMCMHAFIMAVLRGAGDSRTPLNFLALGIFLDIVLNPVLIFGVGPIPAFGITGSALATFIAQGVSLVALIVHLYRRRNPLCLHRDELRLLSVDWALVGVLVRKGIPMGLQLIVISVSSVLMITLVNRFGVDTTAAYGAAFQLWNYIQMPQFALGMAVSAMAAQNVGAQKWDRVNATARIGVIYSVLLTGTLVTLVEIFSSWALGIFLPVGSPALAIAEHLNRIVAWSFVFFGISMVLFGIVRATGAVMAPLAILACSLLLVRFPVAELMLDRWQADAIWWSFPISSIVAVVLAILYYRFGNWRHARMMAPQRAASAPRS